MQSFNVFEIIMALKKNPVYVTGFFNSSTPVVTGFSAEAPLYY